MRLYDPPGARRRGHRAGCMPRVRRRPEHASAPGRVDPITALRSE